MKMNGLEFTCNGVFIPNAKYNFVHRDSTDEDYI